MEGVQDEQKGTVTGRGQSKAVFLKVQLVDQLHEHQDLLGCHSAGSWAPYLLNPSLWEWGHKSHNITGFQWLLRHSNI